MRSKLLKFEKNMNIFHRNIKFIGEFYRIIADYPMSSGLTRPTFLLKRRSRQTPPVRSEASFFEPEIKRRDAAGTSDALALSHE